MTRPVAEQASNGPPAPAAERVFFDPPLPAEPIGPDRRTAGSAPPVIALPDASVLPEDGPLSRRFWGNRKNRHAAGPIVAVSALAIGMFAAGFLAGWWAVRRATTDAGVQPSSSRSQFEGSAPRAAASSPHPTDAPAVAGVGGTVEYVLPDGRTRPDRGARVLALPAERPPTSVLAVAGFRAGAVPTERERATAAIRAVGGDFALTDAEGRYVLQLPPGAYDVLFLSRHVSRDAAQPDDESLTELLAAYFDQPAALVGSVRTDRVSLKHSGGTVRLDHRFER